MPTWERGACEAHGVTIHFLRTGATSDERAKPSLVMLHGLMGSGACWTPVARGLEREVDVILPDARGHGDSSAPDGYGYDDLAGDVVALMDALGLSRPVLVGHSMGGMTAAVVASRRAGLRGLVLVDPTFLSPERQREVHASDVAEQHRQALGLPKTELVARARERRPHRSLELLEIQADARLKTNMRALDVLRPPNPDYREVMRAIEVPALLVIGDSPVVTFEMATELRGIQPRLRVEVVPDAGHGLPFDQPEQLARLIQSFVQKLT